MLQISDDLDRAARVSGANWLGVLRHIIFPLLRPALIATYLLLFVTFLKEYSVALFLFARGSQVIGTTMLEVWAQGGPGPVAALAVIQLLIIAMVMSLSRLIPEVGVACAEVDVCHVKKSEHPVGLASCASSAGDETG